MQKRALVKQFVPLLFVTLIGVWPASGKAQAQIPPTSPERTWSDNTGTFSVEAKLKAVNRRAQQVSLQLSSGQTVVLPIRRLSDQDRDYLASLDKSSNENSPVRTTKVAGIPWVNDLDDAKRLAAGSPSREDDKPILCFRVLGDLTGFM